MKAIKINTFIILTILFFLLTATTAFAYWDNIVINKDSSFTIGDFENLIVPDGYIGITKDGRYNTITLDEFTLETSTLNNKYILLEDIDYNNTTTNHTKIYPGIDTFQGEFDGNGKTVNVNMKVVLIQSGWKSDKKNFAFNNSNEHLPYISRLIFFNLLILPSILPLL